MDANADEQQTGSGLQAARTLIIIPAWNESVTLPVVLDQVVAADLCADILVVNDGSTDATPDIVRNYGPPVELLDLPLNLGVGGAMRAGYRYAVEHDYDYAIQIDGDGQHDPRYVENLLTACQEQDADLVIGARFAGRGDYQARGPRRLAMRLLAIVLSRVCGTKLTDTTSGFKLVNRRGMELFARELPAQYLGDTIEALVIAAKAGLRIRQVPVEVRPRLGGAPSHSTVASAVYLLRAGLALLVALSRRKGGK